jgi:hypothetical protein
MVLKGIINVVFFERKLVACDLIEQVEICKVLKKKIVFFDSNEWV